MDAQRYKKLQNVCATYLKQAKDFEGEKEYIIAIEKYLKVVDILLLLAESSPNYNSWMKLTDEAGTYQKKVKSLIALASIEEDSAQMKVPKPETNASIKPAPAL